jgi:hypothetical protein
MMWTSGFDAIELTRAVHPPATAKLISFVGMTSGPAFTAGRMKIASGNAARTASSPSPRYGFAPMSPRPG